MATQFGSTLEPTSHEDHDMISDVGDIDLDVDFIINTDLVDQEIMLADAPIGDQIPDEIMQEDDYGLDTGVETQMQDQDNNHDGQMDGPNSKLAPTELNMTGIDEVHIDLDFGQHDTRIGNEIQLPDEDEITWNDQAHDATQDTEKTLDEQGQSPSHFVAAHSNLNDGEDAITYVDNNDRYAAPQDTTANHHQSPSRGRPLDDPNHGAQDSTSHPVEVQPTEAPEQGEIDNTDHAAENPEDGGVQLDEISYEEDDDEDAEEEEEVYAGESEAANDSHQNDYQQGEYSSDDYNAILYYKDTPTCLFPPPPESEGLPHTSLLKNSALADSPLPELFRACRDALGADIDTDHGLRMEVTCFGLSINEDDSDCSNMTIAQIIDVYYHLNSNEEAYEPPLIELTLIVRRKLSTQLNDLFKAAEAGKGFTTVQGSNFEYKDNIADNDHVTSEEDEIVEEHQTTTAEELNQADSVFRNDLTSTDAAYSFADSLGEANDVADNQVASATNEDSGHVGNPSEASGSQPAAESAGTNETNSKDTTQNEVEDDLIDYSDDEVENEAAGSSRSSTIQGDRPANENEAVATTNKHDAVHTSTPHAASEEIEHEENDDDFLLDFGNDDPEVEVENEFNSTDPLAAFQESTNVDVQDISSTNRQVELNVGDSVNQESHDEFVNRDANDTLDFELELGSGEVTQANAQDTTSLLEEIDYNDLIDFEDDDQPPNEPIETGTAVPSDSPTGKRTWDEHAENTGADESEKDVKRMKSA